jgi:acetyl-CoA C-acetyltransferase/acetyl-CoA acyltransferase
LAAYDAISLSVPVVQAMAAQAEPDLLVWGTVIPNLGWSNIARETWRDAKLNPTVPAFSVVLACSTSMTATFAAAGMLGGGTDLTMVGGSEVMSRPSIALTAEASKRLTDLFAQDATAALAALQSLTPRDYVLPTKGWANRPTPLRRRNSTTPRRGGSRASRRMIGRSRATSGQSLVGNVASSTIS